MKNRKLLTGLTAIALFAVMPLAVADSHMDHYWTIKVDGKSVSAGTIGITLTSALNEDGTVADPVSVEILVPEKSKRKDIQSTIRNNFRAALGDVLPADDSKPWMRYAGSVETGDTESSRRIDEIVYGQKD